MAKFIVFENDRPILKTAGKNNAFCTAGEKAQEIKFTAPLGTKIEVAKDGKVTLTYTLIERMILGSLARDWDVSVKD